MWRSERELVSIYLRTQANELGSLGKGWGARKGKKIDYWIDLTADISMDWASMEVRRYGTVRPSR
jgi:hypothetical protein